MSTNVPHPVFKVVLALATLTLLTATHWPGLAIRGPVSRMDLVVHACAYTVWSVLLVLATRPKYLHVLVLGLAFAALDESTQPLFRRTFDWTDLAADVFGIALGGTLTCFLRPRPEQRAA